MSRRRYRDEDPEILAERENLFHYVLGAVWVAYLGGALSIEDAEDLERALKRAVRLPRPLPEWTIHAGDTRH
jgi:hypothetical protein